MHHAVVAIVLVCAMLLSSHPALAQFVQQEPKLVATGAVDFSRRAPVAFSADGNTAIVGGPHDNGGVGATRNGGVWTEQEPTFSGSGVVQMQLKADQCPCQATATPTIGGIGDNRHVGAALV